MRLRGNPRLKTLDRHVLGALIEVLGQFKGEARLSPQPGSILLVKLNALGDTILFLAMAQILKNCWPEARIDFLGSEINRPVLERCPHLDRVIILKLSKIISSPAYSFKIVSRLRRVRYDILIDGSQWERITALIALLAGVKATIGFDTEGQKRSDGFHFPIPHRRDLHEIDCFFSLLKPLGIEPSADERRADYVVAPQDRDRLADLALPPEPWIVLHPGCGVHGAPRQWPAVKYAELARRIRRDFPSCQILLTGAGSEAGICRQIEAEEGGTFRNLCGQLDFQLLGALIEKAALLVCGNTGVMHLAAALDTPVVALHGPTDSRRWGPLSNKAMVIQSGKECAPCLYLGYEYDCDDPDCMDLIPVDLVFEACQRFLKSGIESPTSVEKDVSPIQQGAKDGS